MSELFGCINCYLLVRTLLRLMNLCQILFSAKQNFFSALTNIALHRFINCCLFLCMFRFGFYMKHTYLNDCCHRLIRFNGHTHDKDALHEFPPSSGWWFPTFIFSLSQLWRWATEQRRRGRRWIISWMRRHAIWKINKNKPSKCEWDGCFDWWMIWMAVCVWTVATHKIYRIMLQQEKKKTFYSPVEKWTPKTSRRWVLGVSADFSPLQHIFVLSTFSKFISQLKIFLRLEHHCLRCCHHNVGFKSVCSS